MSDLVEAGWNSIISGDRYAGDPQRSLVYSSFAMSTAKAKSANFMRSFPSINMLSGFKSLKIISQLCKCSIAVRI